MDRTRSRLDLTVAATTLGVVASDYKVTGPVELFPQKGGWHYVAVPPRISRELGGRADRGVIAIRARVGSSQWDTSLLPTGDGTHFIALNAKVRKANRLEVGGTVTVHVSVRSR